jgi:hypothetical protein
MFFVQACVSTRIEVTNFKRLPKPGAKIIITQADPVRLSNFFVSPIQPGSIWEQVGSCPRGDVFRPVSQVFTLKSTNMHEGYLVVSGDRGTGVYLPVEKGFLSFETAVTLVFSKEGTK